MNTLLKKLIFSFLTVLIVLFSFAPYFSPAKAQTWYNQSFQEWYGKVYDPTNPSEIFGERYTAAQVQWIIYGLFGFLVNSVTGPQNSGLIQCFISNTANIDICITQLKDLLIDKGANKSTLGIQNPTLATTKVQPEQNMWSLVFASDRPISGISYARERFQKFNLVPVAHAQTVGFGFTMLEPIQGMWTAIRNISFGLFVIVAVVFAFMIMFRVKLSPQTVISVQSALPKIIIALVLVTFSYAIAGFLIDLMYVVIGFISLAMSPLAWGIPATTVFNFLTKGQPLGMNANWGFFVMGIIYIVLFIVFLLILLIMSLGLIGSAIVGLGLGTLLSGIASTGIGLTILILVAVIAALVVIWLFLKIMWSLIKAFASVILLTIFAPLQITIGTVIPNFGFGAWFKSYVSALSTFVVTGVIALLSFIFLFAGVDVGFSSYAPNLLSGILNALFGTAGSGWLTGNTSNFSASWPPLLGGGNAGPSLGLLFLGVSFVLFTLIPKANEIVQGLITGRPFAYGTAIGEAFGPAKWAWGQTGAPIIEGARKRAFEGGQVEMVNKLSHQFEKMYGMFIRKKGTDTSGA